MITSSHFNRRRKYQIQTIILKSEKKVIKKGLNPEAVAYLKEIYQKINQLTKLELPFKLNKYNLKDNQLTTNYLDGNTFLYLIEEALFNHNFPLASHYLAKISEIINHLPDSKVKEKTPFKLHYTPIKLIDLTADNFILTPDNKIYLIDLEWWSDKPLAKEYLIWRLLTFTSIRLKHFIRLYPGEKKIISLNTYLPSTWLRFLPDYFKYHPYFAELENKFQQQINLVQAGYITPHIPKQANKLYHLKEKLSEMIKRRLGS